MYTKISETYKNTNWVYLGISDEAINSRYDWVNISLPVENRKYPWAHEYDIIKFFILIRTFRSKQDAIAWVERNAIELASIHFDLMDSFCYTGIDTKKSIDELINETDSNDLLCFIQSVLDRSLLWYNPEPCWPGDFKRILRETTTNLNLETQELKLIKEPIVEGVDFVSGEDYTHVFYKFQNLINGIQKRELYYDLSDLAIQAHGALLKSMELFFEYKNSSISEEDWEMKLSEIISKETSWCIAQLSNNKKQN